MATFAPILTPVVATFAPILTSFHTGCLRLSIRCHQHCSWRYQPQGNPKPKK